MRGRTWADLVGVNARGLTIPLFSIAVAAPGAHAQRVGESIDDL